MEQKKEINVWKVGFWVTAVVLILTFLYSSFNENKSGEVVIINKTICDPCNFITATPSWMADGRLIGTGYNPNLTTQILIDNNITFVYRDGCGWCDKQKEKIDVNILNEKGLTIRC